MYRKEGEMYHHVLKFLKDIYGTEEFNSGYTYADGVSKEIDSKAFTLYHLERKLKPDVFGMTGNGVIYLCEGKIDCGGTELDKAIGQALAYQRFSHYLLVFFPESYFENNEPMLQYVLENINLHNLGLLLVRDTGEVIEKLKPKLSPYLQSSKENITISTVDGILQSQTLLSNLDNYVLDDDTDNLAGARAFIVRDICEWLYEYPDENPELSDEDFIKDFVSYIENEMKISNLSSTNYWSAQAGRGDIDKRPYRRSKRSLYAGLFLKLIEFNDQTSIYNLTPLGNALVSISNFNGKPELSKEERAFFFSLAWNSKVARNFILILKESGNRKFKLYTNPCGHETIRIHGEKIICDDEDIDCEEEIQPEDLSIRDLYYYNYKNYPPYWEIVFWLQSQIFTQGSTILSYNPIIN